MFAHQFRQEKSKYASQLKMLRAVEKLLLTNRKGLCINPPHHTSGGAYESCVWLSKMSRTVMIQKTQ